MEPGAVQSGVDNAKPKTLHMTRIHFRCSRTNQSDARAGESCSKRGEPAFRRFDMATWQNNPRALHAGELRYLLREIANLLGSQDKFVLVEPTAPRRSGKLLQLTRAREFFNVPPFRAVLNSPPVTTGPEVIKSLAKELPEGQNIFSTRVDPSALALRYPWFMQQYIDAVADVTVLVIRHRLFAFELERDFLETSIDWREIPGKCSAWKPMELQETTRDAIHRYMESILLGFGRLDFLRDHNGDLQFCEVNPNPQFAWLGLDDTSGIRSAIRRTLPGFEGCSIALCRVPHGRWREYQAY